MHGQNIAMKDGNILMLGQLFDVTYKFICFYFKVGLH
jgi:hypothetical protein